MKTLFVLVVLFSHGDGTTTLVKGPDKGDKASCEFASRLISGPGIKFKNKFGKLYQSNKAWCEEITG